MASPETWLGLNALQAQVLAAGAQGFAAFVTLALVVAAVLTLRQNADQQRVSVMPVLKPEGRWFGQESGVHHI